MSKTVVIERFGWPVDGRSYLRVKDHTEVTIIPEKKFFRHGNLVNTRQGGNGYHGNCENCGLPLTTFLGGTSWDGTKCIKKEERIEDRQVDFYWERNPKRASKLNEDQAREYQYILMRKQGWGRYNFLIKNIKSILEKKA